jgi:hypothetical protein
MIDLGKIAVTETMKGVKLTVAAAPDGPLASLVSEPTLTAESSNIVSIQNLAETPLSATVPARSTYTFDLISRGVGTEKLTLHTSQGIMDFTIEVIPDGTLPAVVLAVVPGTVVPQPLPESAHIQARDQHLRGNAPVPDLPVNPPIAAPKPGSMNLTPSGRQTSTSTVAVGPPAPVAVNATQQATLHPSTTAGAPPNALMSGGHTNG